MRKMYDPSIKDGSGAAAEIPATEVPETTVEKVGAESGEAVAAD